MAENSGAGIRVGGPVTASDADSDELTYTFEGTDAASFAISSTSGQIATVAGVTYNFEVQSSYSVTVKADDGKGGTDTIAVTISLTDVEEQSAKPDKPTLAAVEGSSTSLTATWEEPDLNGGPDIQAYELRYRQGTSGVWADQASFITGTSTTISGLTPDTEYQAQVRAFNGELESDWSDSSDAVSTNAELAPTITRVEVTSTPQLTSSGGTTPDTYGADEDIEFSVTFSAAVEVTGDPQFGFSLAGARVADYDSGSGSVMLRFIYTVQPTDRDDNGIWVGNHATGNATLQLDAADAITSLGGTDDANLEHTALEALPGHKVDGSRTADVPGTPVEVTLHLSDADGEVGEGAGPVTVTATASPASAAAFTVTVSASAVGPATDDDFELSSNRVLSFDANATGSTGTVTIAPVDDGDPEPNQVVTVSGSASIADVIGPGDVTLTIRDDDLVRISGICNRTQRVEDRILRRLKYVHSFKGGCGDVNETHLAKVKFLGLRRNPSTESAFTLSLRSDDFKGLVNLEELDLADTRLSSLPAGAFAGLASLETLNLNKNRLRSLPTGVFDELTSLETLRLQQNPSLRSLPYDELEALLNLRELRVDPEGRRGYQMAGSERAVELEVEPGGETTYQVRLTHRPTYSPTEQPTLTVSSDAAGVVATPRTLRFTRENWFRRQTVRVVALASAAGKTATLNHTSVAVTLDRPPPPVTVRVMTGNSQRALSGQFVSPPQRHDGTKRVKVRVAFSEAVEESPKNVGEHGVRVEGGEVISVRPVVGQAPGKGTRSASGRKGETKDREVVWEFEIEPDSHGDLTVSLEAGRPCDETGAICTADGRALSEGISTTVPGPVPLTARFHDVPETHDGESAFTFRVTFSEDIGISDQSLREDAFTVTGGAVTMGRRVDDRRDLFEVTVQPGSNGDVTITLPSGRDCGTQGAICTKGENRRRLTNTPSATVAGPPNTPAAGAPTITGTAQVGETLTADTSDIADDDGLNNVQYEYQWLAGDSEIAGATGLTYTLADADEGKAIQVEVTFTDDAGNEETLTSAATAVVATAEPSEPPDRPRGLDATATHGSVTITWNDPEDESITGYVILRRVRVNDQGGDFSVLVANTGSAATTYTDTTVAASTTYTYRIKAINEHGVSERSRWVHIDTPAPPVPDKPTGLDATASNGQVVLTWDDPDDDSITGYVILRRLRYDDPSGYFEELTADTGTAATTYTDNTVEADTDYTYRIKAINEHGTSERSRWFHIDTPAAP